MSTDRHARAKECFLTAVDLSEAEREIYLDRLRREDGELYDAVRGMLAVDSGAPEFLSRPAVRPPPPEIIGGFRVLREIGTGGMGTVYEAEQDHPRRRVALKLLETGLLSPNFVRRFEFEGELLARLSHTGIAQVFATGTAPGAFGPQPYIAMELVDGLPLTRYVRDNAIHRRARIELVARIADAVEHAHRRGVIHRDLKPGNILVDAEGQPKVLDFGIGRALEKPGAVNTLATEAGQILGTLQYMSPEQALGAGHAIDTRADVYALGMLLYEVLADALPYETSGKPLHAALQTVITAEPAPLSTHDRTLAGDLEIITSHALEKAPERRYGSAGAFADDVRRHLAHEPIAAQPTTRLYRIKKFARRNRVLVGGAAATVIALVLGLAGTTWQAIRAHEREVRANEAAETAQGILQHLLLDGIAAVDPRAIGPRASAADVFTRVEEQLAGKFGGKPEVEAAVRDALGSIWRALGKPERAEPLLVRALDMRRELFGSDDARTLDTLEHLASCNADLGRQSAALALCEEVHARRRALLGEEDPATLTALNDLGVALWNAGRSEDALLRLQECVRLRESVLGPSHDKTLSSKNNLAVQLNLIGRSSEGCALLKGVLASRRERLAENHPDVLLARVNFARCLETRGELTDAEGTWRGLLAGYEEAYGAGHPLTAHPTQGLATWLEAQGRAEEAEPLFRRAVALFSEAFGPEHVEAQGATNDLARCLERHGKVDEALMLLYDIDAMQRRIWPGGHPARVLSLNTLGQTLRRAKRHAEAITAFEEGIAMARASKDVPSDSLSQCLYNLGVLLRVEMKRHADAVRHLSEALELDRVVNAPGHDVIAGDMFHLASALLDAGEAQQAEPLWRALLAPPYDLGPDHNRTPGRLRSLGNCLAALGRREEALQQLELSVTRAEAVFGADDNRTRGARTDLERVRGSAEKR